MKNKNKLKKMKKRVAFSSNLISKRYVFIKLKRPIALREWRFFPADIDFSIVKNVNQREKSGIHAKQLNASF